MLWSRLADSTPVLNENDTLNLVLDKAERTKKLETELQQVSDREAALQNLIAALEAQLKDIQETKSRTTKDTSLSAPNPSVSSPDREDVSSLKDAVKLLVRSQTQLVHKFDLFLERSTNSSLLTNTPSSEKSDSASTKEPINNSFTSDEEERVNSHEELISRAIDKILAHNNSAEDHEDK